ncbi:MAG: DUF3795 domain-containing protein [Christensenellales bacterium]|jgi:hypothetical protein
MQKRSCCGVDCSKCPAYIAGREREALIKALSEEKGDARMLVIKREMWCDGCHSDSPRTKAVCGNCQIRACAKEKQLHSCGQCYRYPCDMIEKKVPKDYFNRQALDEVSTKEQPVFSELS